MKPFLYLGSWAIPTYHLVISLTFSLLLFWVVQRAQRRKLMIGDTLDLSLAIMIGGFLGARIFHVIYEEPLYYADNPSRVLEFWQGGFVFYGGVFGALLCTEWVLLRRQLEKGIWQDLFAPLFPIGYALGRLGCLAAGCCYGRPSDLPWSISFSPGVEAPPMTMRHPAQVYAFLWELLVFFLIIFLERKKPIKQISYPGALFHTWLLLHGIGRIIMEYFRADHRGSQIGNLSISTWISVGLILFSVFEIFRHNMKEQNASRAS